MKIVRFWEVTELDQISGMVSVSAKSLNNLLTWPNEKDHPRNDDGNTSTACVIVVGGAQEALNTRPNNYQLVLKKRKGFVKMALRYTTPYSICGKKI